MSKFNLNSLLSTTSLNNGMTENEGNKNSQKLGIKLIPVSVYDLVPSKDNFYSMQQIEELKTAIELAGGIKQNLTVTPLDNGKYKVLAGHRRLLASISLVEEGKTEYEFVPCGIEYVEEDTELQEIREELLLILMNSQRDKTDWDKVEEVKRLRTILERYKKREKIPGRMREIIADALNTSVAQVGRMESISKNLSQEFKEEFKEEKINISTAYELSTLPQAEQQSIYEEHVENGTSPNINAVKEKKAELKEKVEEASKPTNEVPPEPVIIERVPEEIVQELQELRMKVNQNEEADKLVIKFSIQFESLAKNFKEILETIKGIDDIEAKEKCRGTINILINKMMERL